MAAEHAQACSHFLLTCSKNHQMITQEHLVLLTYLQWQSRDTSRDTELLHPLPAPESPAVTGLLLVPTPCQKVPVPLCRVSPDFSASPLVCKVPLLAECFPGK